MNKFVLQTMSDGEWHKVCVGNRSFCEGYQHALSKMSPRPANRIVSLHEGIAWFDMKPLRDDQIKSEVNRNEECGEVSIGLVAGWATPEQFELAGRKALDIARSMRGEN